MTKNALCQKNSALGKVKILIFLNNSDSTICVWSLHPATQANSMRDCQINPSLWMFGGWYYFVIWLRKHFLIEQGMNCFHDSGLCDFGDTVSYAKSLSRKPLYKAVRHHRIDILGWTHIQTCPSLTPPWLITLHSFKSIKVWSLMPITLGEPSPPA